VTKTKMVDGNEPMSPEEAKAAILKGMPRSLLEDAANWRQDRDQTRFRAFDELVQEGCDAMFLALKLALLHRIAGVDTWGGLTGFENRERLETALGRFRRSAVDLEKIRAAVVGRSFLQDGSCSGLPEQLRAVVQVVERFVGQVSPGSRRKQRRADKLSITPQRNFVRSAVIATMVRHVVDVTGRPHDREVANLVAANPQKFGQNEQAAWRQAHADLIRAARYTG
jgi:hypothetical protein